MIGVGISSSTEQKWLKLNKFQTELVRNPSSLLYGMWFRGRLVDHGWLQRDKTEANNFYQVQLPLDHIGHPSCFQQKLPKGPSVRTSCKHKAHRQTTFHCCGHVQTSSSQADHLPVLWPIWHGQHSKISQSYWWVFLFWKPEWCGRCVYFI